MHAGSRPESVQSQVSPSFLAAIDMVEKCYCDLCPCSYWFLLMVGNRNVIGVVKAYVSSSYTQTLEESTASNILIHHGLDDTGRRRSFPFRAAWRYW